ncbi:MAG: exonuclease domain-containing protein [Christensenellales bacterium]|jgi:DNA polymerase-3 subunit epsilon
MAGSLLVFDTEATDLEPGQICQLAYLLEQDGKITVRNYFFSVDDMSPGAQEVHGFSREMLAELSGGFWFEDKAQEILSVFNAAGTVAGHNVRADERYLRVEMERSGLKLKRLNTFCTMNYASGIMNMQRKVVTGRPKPPKLSELAAYYGVTTEQVRERTAELFGNDGETGLHDARFDTVMTWLCLRAAVDKGDLRGL